jgi:uncharacterized MAPEG superfamily protein
MLWLELVTLAALFQYLLFGVAVGRARARHGVRAPAVTGHEGFERAYRVQMNTLELLVVFVPSLWLAARHWSPEGMAAFGAIYVIGRFVYARAYLQAPGTRTLGFLLSIAPIGVLMAAAAIGAVLHHPV